MKMKYRQYDSRGALYVDCSECERGGNGADANKCSCGARIKKGYKGGCFSGKLMAAYETPAPDKREPA